MLCYLYNCYDVDHVIIACCHVIYINVTKETMSWLLCHAVISWVNVSCHVYHASYVMPPMSWANVSCHMCVPWQAEDGLCGNPGNPGMCQLAGWPVSDTKYLQGMPDLRQSLSITTFSICWLPDCVNVAMIMSVLYIHNIRILYSSGNVHRTM